MSKKQKPNLPTETKKGAFLLARDLRRVFTQYRHTESETAIAEAKRIAVENNERVLILKVVGVLDKRKKTVDTPPDSVV